MTIRYGKWMSRRLSLMEDVYVKQSKGFVDPKNPNNVCKLQRSIYGLKQAFRSWNLHFDEAIKEFSFLKNEDEPCVYKKFMLGFLCHLHHMAAAEYNFKHKNQSPRS